MFFFFKRESFFFFFRKRKGEEEEEEVDEKKTPHRNRRFRRHVPGSRARPSRRDQDRAVILVDHFLEGGLDLLLLVGDDFVNRGPAADFFLNFFFLLGGGVSSLVLVIVVFQLSFPLALSHLDFIASSKKRRIAGPPRSSYSPWEARSETVSTPRTQGSPRESPPPPPDRGGAERG